MGLFDIEGLVRKDEKYETDWFDLTNNQILDVLTGPPPFEVHAEERGLFGYFETEFWPKE